MPRIPRKSMNRRVREKVQEISSALMVGRKPKIITTGSKRKFIRKVLALEKKNLIKFGRKIDSGMAKEIIAEKKKEHKRLINSGAHIYSADKSKHLLFVENKKKQTTFAAEAAHTAYMHARMLQKKPIAPGISEAFDFLEQYIYLLKKGKKKNARNVIGNAVEYFEMFQNEPTSDKRIRHFAGIAIGFSALVNGFDSIEKIRKLELLLSRKEFAKANEDVQAIEFIRRLGKEMRKDPKYLDMLVERAKRAGVLREL